MERASKNFIANLKKQKRESSLLFLDNVKIIKDALAKGVIKAECVLTSLDEAEFLELELECENVPIFRVDQSIIESLADTKTPQKVLCVAYCHQDVVIVPKTNFLVMDALQDPGNVGTLIRTAKASGFEYVFLVDSVKKSNPKLIRSSVGAVFDNKVFEMSRGEFVKFAKDNHLNLICCDMNGENIFEFTQRDEIVGIIVGNEGQGVSETMRALCARTVKIPMCEGIESLNVAVSGAIIMYEINKRNF